VPYREASFYHKSRFLCYKNISFWEKRGGLKKNRFLEKKHRFLEKKIGFNLKTCVFRKIFLGFALF
jgi:hypothetical protein